MKYINAEQFKRDLHTASEHSESEIVNAVKVFCDLIDEAPAEDVEPVIHAHWITINDSSMSKSVLCSHCKDNFYFTKKGQLNIDMMPYCPNCSARMDEVGNEP